MSGLPTNSAHLSEVSTDDLLEQYGGEVESQFKKTSIMRQYAKIRPVRGTDTITNNRVGRTTLKALVPGVRPDAVATPFGKVSLTVDTIVLARDNRSMLNELQIHFDARMELAQDHGKEIGFFFDQAFIIMGIKGSGMDAPVLGDGSANKQSIGPGIRKTLAAAGDELDPDKLYRKIADIIVEMEEAEVPVEELVVFIRPTEFDVLLDNDKLTSSVFSAENGDFAKGTIHKIKDARTSRRLASRVLLSLRTTCRTLATATPTTSRLPRLRPLLSSCTRSRCSPVKPSRLRATSGSTARKSSGSSTASLHSA